MQGKGYGSVYLGSEQNLDSAPVWVSDRRRPRCIVAVMLELYSGTK